MIVPEALIQALGVTLSIDGRYVFRDFGINVSAGDIVTLVGANGCGKTSLLNIFSGLLQANGGEARLYGASVNHARPSAVATRGRGVARSFQVPFLQDDFSVAANVQLGGRIARAACADTAVFHMHAHDIAERLNLKSIWQNRVATLSLGQRRRVELARVFATSAGILLLDEPFANLDAGGVEAVGSLARAAATSGAALLIVEHGQEAIERFSDRRIRMLSSA